MNIRKLMKILTHRNKKKLQSYFKYHLHYDYINIDTEAVEFPLKKETLIFLG